MIDQEEFHHTMLGVHLVAQLGYSPAVAAKGMLMAVCITFIAINSLAMRPLYPAVLTITCVALHIYVWALAVVDPRTVWAGLLWATPAVGHRLFASQIIFLVIIGQGRNFNR